MAPLLLKKVSALLTGEFDPGEWVDEEAPELADTSALAPPEPPEQLALQALALDVDLVEDKQVLRS